MKSMKVERRTLYNLRFTIIISRENIGFPVAAFVDYTPVLFTADSRLSDTLHAHFNFLLLS